MNDNEEGSRKNGILQSNSTFSTDGAGDSKNDS